MRLLPARKPSQPHHHGLRANQAPRAHQILHHPPLIHAQPLERKHGLAQAPHARDKRDRHRRPLEMPRPARALEVAHHAIQHEAGLGAQDLALRQHDLGADGVALLRHGARRAAVRHVRLGDLAQLARAHDDEIQRDLAERAADQREEVDGVGDAVARDVPSDARVGQGEGGREGFAHADAGGGGAERGERAGGAAELGEQRGLLEGRQAREVAVDGGEPDGGFVAEGDGQGVLEVGAAGHGGVAVADGEAGEGGLELGEQALDDGEALFDLQDRGEVHDVLGGGAPVDVAGCGCGGLVRRVGAGCAGLRTGFFRDPCGHLLDEREDGVADDLGPRRQQVPVDLGHVAVLADGFCGGGGHDALGGLGLGQRALGLDEVGDVGALREALAHFFGAEDVAEELGVEDGGG